MIPLHIFTQRSIVSGFLVSAFVGAHMTLFIYYLPIWFEAIKGDSAVQAGIRILPLVLSMVGGSILAGTLTSTIGYYTPFLIVGTCIAAIGAGLLTTLQIRSSAGKWIGYQILYGLGLGCCFQSPTMAAQTVLPKRKVSVGASLMLFAMNLFGAIFVSVGQNVLDDQLSQRFSKFANITTQHIENAGITGLLNSILPQDYNAALLAFNSSLRVCFQVALACTCLAVFSSLGMEWRNVKKQEIHRSRDAEEVKTTEENKVSNITGSNEMEETRDVDVLHANGVSPTGANA